METTSKIIDEGILEFQRLQAEREKQEEAFTQLLNELDVIILTVERAEKLKNKIENKLYDIKDKIPS